MDLLSSAPVAEVLQRLYREAESGRMPRSMQTHASNMTNFADAMRRDVVEAETEDLTGLYRSFADNFLSVSPVFGRFLYMCARGCKAKRIVEFGSSMGISAIYMAAALRDMGGGRLIGTDLEPTRLIRARAKRRRCWAGRSCRVSGSAMRGKPSSSASAATSAW